MKKIISFLLVATLIFGACGNGGEEGLPIDGADLTGITVEPGMNLVGIVKYSDGTPAAGIPVTDGYSYTTTRNDGIYQMARNEKARFVYYCLPADCQVPRDRYGIPEIYKLINTALDVYRHDFILTKLPGGAENDFRFYAIADPQVQTSGDINRFREETLADVAAHLEPGVPSYGMALGDIVYDKPTFMYAMKLAYSTVDLPIFQIIGNHDHNATLTGDYETGSTFENNFGPLNYSFDRGNVHIVGMDNVLYEKSQTYTGGFNAEQYAWLVQDLSYVPKDKMIIFCAHIPFRTGGASDHMKGKYYRETLDLLAQYAEAHIMIGHTHYNQNYVHTVGTKQIYEHIHGAACGAWWTGTINSDGTPNGYGIYEVSGSTMTEWKYKSTRYGGDHQIRLYPPGSFGKNDSYVVANVWNADADWKVELFENGVKTKDMTAFTDYERGAYTYFKDLGKTEPTGNAATGWFRRPAHQYRAIPDSEDATFKIVATDRFGNRYEQDETVTTTISFSKYIP